MEEEELPKSPCDAAKGGPPQSSFAVAEPSIGNNGVTVEECERMIQKTLKKPMAKFLIEQLEKSGCTLGENFIMAVYCTQSLSGGYTPGRGIRICSNHMRIQDEVNQTVFHELIHAYDECVAKNLNWNNPAHRACSEIRANHLSGDCHFVRELLRGHTKLRGHEPKCIRRRVMMSLIGGNPIITETAGRDAMEAVYDTCYNDTKPFDRAP